LYSDNTINTDNAQTPLLLLPPPSQIVPEEAVHEIVPRSRWQRFLHWEHLGLYIILVLTIVLHIISISKPPTIVWDETWYVGDARSIFSGTKDLRPEHPPLAKLFIVAGAYIFNGFETPERDSGALTTRAINSDETDTILDVSDASLFIPGDTIRIEAEQMRIQSIHTEFNQITVERSVDGTIPVIHSDQLQIFIFTDKAIGWRFFSVIFGTIGIVLFYYICRNLKLSWKATMICTFLFGLENMGFLHAGLALLDVYMVTFMLAAILMYLRGGYLLSGIMVALSANCKLVGALIIIAIFLHWLIYRRDKWQWFFGSMVLAGFIFVFFLISFDYFIYGYFENPITRLFNNQNGMLFLTDLNKFTDPKLSISSRPWTWLYPQWVDVLGASAPFIVYSYDPQYISFISSTLQILIVPTIGYMIYKTVKGNAAAPVVLLWFVVTYLIWIPLDIITNRVTFVFYFLATIPAICIGIGLGLSDSLEYLKSRRLKFSRITPGAWVSYYLIGLYLLIHFGIFIVFNPAIPVIIKTWEYPWNIGITSTTTVTESVMPLVLLLTPYSGLLRSKYKNTMTNIILKSRQNKYRALI
jgi:dolichyl-phosphate-mannose-protein mannosyltransferase